MNEKLAKKDAKPTKDLPTIEDHARDFGLPMWQFVGLKASRQWPSQKPITGSEFAKELKQWLAGPTCKDKEMDNG